MTNEITNETLVPEFINKYHHSGISELTSHHETQDYILAKLSNTEVETDPFPYIQIKDFLPSSFYQDAMAAWPEDSEFNAVKLQDDGGRMRQYVGSRKAIMMDAWPKSPEMSPGSIF